MCLFGSINAQTPRFDKSLADSLGADEYGMKTYVMVILKTGPTQITDQAERDSLFAGHMSNIHRLVSIGKLVVAGPFEKNEQTYRGMFIFDAALEDVISYLAMDPTIQVGIFETEIFQWYGSAALKTYLPNHSLIEQKKP